MTVRTRNVVAIATACGLTLGSAATRAADVTGSFAGTITSGTDGTGVFGTSGTLDGAAISGSFVYDTSLFDTAVAGTTNTANGTAPGALTVTLTIGSGSHVFTDQTSAALYFDTAASEFTMQNANSQSGSGSTVNETFSLDVLDPIMPFFGSTDLDQSFSSILPYSSLGTFAITNTSPELTASGTFTLTALTLTGTAVPEPASVTLLPAGLFGVAVGRSRQAMHRLGGARPASCPRGS